MMNPRLQLFRRAFVPVALATSSTAVYLSLRPVLHADAPSSSTTPSSIPGIPFEPRDHPRKSTKGEFLDENGKPCKACTSFSSWMKTGPPRAPSAEGSSSSKAKPEPTKAGGTAAAAAAAASLAASFGGERSEAELRELRKDCPPDIEELGRSTWTFLHATVSALPAFPPPELQEHLSNLLLALPHLYPCPHCRHDLAQSVIASGGRATVLEAVQTREGAEKWVWERHEEVNKKLGKEGGVPLEKVRERWRDGPKDGRCDFGW